MWACREGRTDVVEFLIANGAEIHMTNTYGMSALICALHFPEEDKTLLIVEKLLSIDPNLAKYPDNKLNTPLHYAAEKGYFQCCKVLLEKGADITARNGKMQTPLEVAKANAIVFLRERWQKLEEESNNIMRELLEIQEPLGTHPKVAKIRRKKRSKRTSPKKGIGEDIIEGVEQKGSECPNISIDESSPVCVSFENELLNDDAHQREVQDRKCIRNIEQDNINDGLLHNESQNKDQSPECDLILSFLHPYTGLCSTQSKIEPRDEIIDSMQKSLQIGSSEDQSLFYNSWHNRALSNKFDSSFRNRRSQNEIQEIDSESSRFAEILERDYPFAAALDIKPENFLGEGLDKLSPSQLDILEQLFLDGMACLGRQKVCFFLYIYFKKVYFIFRAFPSLQLIFFFFFKERKAFIY